MTRQMRNVRTGKIAVFDADLVESGRWEEIVAEQPKADKPAKPAAQKKNTALKLPQIVATGALDVTPNEGK